MSESFSGLSQLCEIVHDELRHERPNGNISVEIGKWKMNHLEHSHYVVGVYVAGVLNERFSSADGDLKTQINEWRERRGPLLLFKQF